MSANESTNIIPLFMKELKLDHRSAAHLMFKLPGSVIRIYTEHKMTKEFLAIAKDYLTEDVVSKRTRENNNYLISELKAIYSAERLQKVSGVDLSIIQAVYNGSQMSDHILNHLASFVDLTSKYVKIGDYYLGEMEAVSPPVIYGFIESDYQYMRNIVKLPHGSLVGEDIELAPFRVGFNAKAEGDLTALSSSYLMDYIDSGDVAFAMSVGVSPKMRDWCKSLISSGNRDRVIMTINSTSISADNVITGIIKSDLTVTDQLSFDLGDDNHRDEDKFMVIIKVPKSKGINITFKGTRGDVNSYIDMSKVKIHSMNSPVITVIGGN